MTKYINIYFLVRTNSAALPDHLTSLCISAGNDVSVLLLSLSPTYLPQTYNVLASESGISSSEDSCVHSSNHLPIHTPPLDMRHQHHPSHPHLTHLCSWTGMAIFWHSYGFHYNALAAVDSYAHICTQIRVCSSTGRKECMEVGCLQTIRSSTSYLSV